MIQSCIIFLSTLICNNNFLRMDALKFQNIKFKNPNVTSCEVIFSIFGLILANESDGPNLMVKSKSRNSKFLDSIGITFELSDSKDDNMHLV